MTRLDSLTGVRFFAAFLVFGFHSVAYVGGSQLDVFSAGMVGVSLFYILSGFVMSWTARESDLVGHFYRRRFARVYPAFFVAWLLSLALLLSRGSLDLWDALPPTLLQAWFPVEAAYFAGSAVFWSLSCEAFFYLVFPFLNRLLARFGIRGLIVIGLAAAAVSIGTAVAMLGVAEGPLTRWALIIFPPLRLMEFVIGAVLGRLFRRGIRVPVPVSVAVVLAGAGVYLSSIAPYSLSRYAVTLLPFVVLVAALASSDLKNRPSVFRWTPVVSLGVWSYCFYLLHAMVLVSVFVIASRTGVIDDGASSLRVWGVLGFAFIASVAAAWILHVLVERPYERRFRVAGPKETSQPPESTRQIQ
ncbi:acyltransferase family protein [Marisediminicola senii]|uniref:acyltransferase family protein n=1 Tax=Marisediminicola senii TaxID=2711233 RepID=UPI0013EA735B|nr:acyltransferase [Marisediminicola senii]